MKLIYNRYIMRQFPMILVLIVVSLMMLTSCFRDTYYFKSEDLIARFSAGYEPGNNGLLRTDGYYFWENRFVYDAFILCEDGTALKIYSFKNECIDSIGYPTTRLDEQIERVVNLGIYRFIDRYLIIDEPSGFYMYWEFMGGSWDLRRYKYEIIDESTIRLISDYSYERGKFTNRDRIYRFVKASPLPEMPEFDTDDKMKKLMWENEDEWKTYKRQREESERIRKQAERNNSQAVR